MQSSVPVPQLPHCSKVRKENTHVTKAPVVSDPDWIPVKSLRAAVPSSKDKLLQTGWSVPVKSCIGDFAASEPGVCFALKAEAKKIVSELKGEQPLAMLVAAPINGKG